MSMVSFEVLEKVYGDDAGRADGRFGELEGRFTERFGDGRDILHFTAPGRTEVIGNHTDHNGGKILAASITMDTVGVAAPNGTGVVRVDSAGYPLVSVDLADLASVPRCQGTLSLLAGMLEALQSFGWQVGGFDACLSSEVIPAAGVSSSASFEMCVCAMVDALFNGGAVPVEDYARAGQYAENAWWDKGSGLMDQMACAVGGTILLDFSDGVAYERLGFSYGDLGCDLVLVNTGGGHADLSAEYSAVPDEMRAVAAALGAAQLCETSEEALMGRLAEVRAAVANDRAILRAIHFFQECARVEAAERALAAGDEARVLALINDSGASSAFLLQNAHVASNPAEQPIPFAVALSMLFLREQPFGACRLHGGGFAGVIMCAVPKEATDDYVALMAGLFGQKNVYRTNIRATGAACLEDLKA